jgi:hypothetical protein
MSHEEGDQRKRERKDKQSPLGAMYESENAIDGTEAAKNDRRMTAWLWIDTRVSQAVPGNSIGL